MKKWHLYRYKIAKMRLKHLEIEGFRGFSSKQIIRFPEGKEPVVFVGVNGAGKTSILDVIINCLRYVQGQLSSEAFSTSNYSRYDVNVNEDSSKNYLTWEWSEQYEELVSGFEIESFDDTKKFIGRKEIADLANSIKKDAQFYKKTSLPIIVAYPSNRSFSKPNVSLNKKSKIVSRINQYDALKQAFQPALDFDDFFEWFRITEDIENEKRLTENNTFTEPSLEAVRSAIMSFLDGFSNLRIQRSPMPDMVIHKKGIKLFVSQLSHGEKMVLGTVGDLARRLAIANPGLKNPLIGQGVVLIDEVDLHLHPDWQRTIIKKLRTTFPNIQFILTTHSTLILNHLQKENIFLLENNECLPLSVKYPNFNPYGADVEDILIEIQKVTEILPHDIKELFQQYFSLIQNGKINEAKTLQKKLKTITDPEHPEILKGEAEIQFKELIS